VAAAASPDFKAGVARIEATLGREAKLAAGTDPSGLMLKPNYGSIFMPQPSGKARGTVVLYHGYTAGPWQYQEMADKFFKAGYNVYAPRIVGHGLMTPDGETSTRELPKASERDAYYRFVDDRLEEAKGLGAPVYTIGLSGGGALALATAERHPSDVKGVVAMAPYMGPDKIAGKAAPVLAFLDRLTFGGLSELLSHVNFGKKDALPNNETPHTQGSLGQAWAMRSIGYSLKAIPVPTQFFTTEGDFLSGANKVGALIDRSGGGDKHGWYHFPESEHVPHAMLDRRENPVGAAVDAIDRIALDFVETGHQVDRARVKP
jgi:esterase/lipase